MEKDKQDQIIALLAKNERNIGRLYSACAEKFPDYYNFFLILSDEEAAHSKWMMDMYKETLDGPLVFNPKRFNINALKLFADYVNKKLLEVNGPDISLKRALGVGLDIENTLIESKWFEVYETDQMVLKISLKRLQEANYIHKRKITEALRTIKDTPLDSISPK